MVMDKIDEMVRSRTAHLQPAGAELAERGLADAARLDSDPEMLRLVETLRDSPDWPERIRAWEKVRDMGPTVRGWQRALRDLIHQADGWGRIFAAESLAWHACSESDAVPVLLVALASTLELHRYDWSRMACGAIGRYDNLSRPLVDQSVPAMLDALEAEDGNVQGYAAKALGNWGVHSRPALVKLADLHDHAQDPLRAHYLEVMQKIDPSIKSAQDARVLALDDQNDTVRATAIASMVRNGMAEGTDPARLLSLFRDESADVRRNLAIALGDLRIPGDDCMVRLRLLAEDSDPAVRLAAAYAFIRLSVNTAENLKRLRQALRSEVERLRLLAAWALGEVGGAAPWRCRSALKMARRNEQCGEVKEALEQALHKLG